MLAGIARQFKEFLKAEEGPTAVEYAVMLALIIVICLVAITALVLVVGPTRIVAVRTRFA